MNKFKDIVLFISCQLLIVYGNVSYNVDKKKIIMIDIQKYDWDWSKNNLMKKKGGKGKYINFVFIVVI